MHLYLNKHEIILYILLKVIYTLFVYCNKNMTEKLQF